MFQGVEEDINDLEEENNLKFIYDLLLFKTWDRVTLEFSLRESTFFLNFSHREACFVRGFYSFNLEDPEREL